MTTYTVTEQDDAAARYLLYEGDERIGEVPRYGRLVAGLLWRLNQAAAAAADPGLLLVHAAVAEHDGHAVMLPGASGAGKSTLVAALVRGGMGYLSDEIAAVSQDLDVTPYPKPISLEPGSWSLLPDLEPLSWLGPRDAESAWQVPPTAIRPDAIAAGGRLSVIVLPEVRPGSALVEPVDRADALRALMAGSFHTGPDAGSALPRLRAVVDAVPCVRLHFSDLDDATTRVLQLMEQHEML